MASFAIIAEGVTDQVVIENILHGCFQDDDDLVVNHVQPRRDTADPSPGGWTLVFRALRAGDHRSALQHNDYVVIHLDTDVAEEPGFDVSRRAEDGVVLGPEALIERVKQRLNGVMDPAFCEAYGDRIVFAIAVDSVECWLLPLLYEGEPARQAKTTGCLEAADWKLRRSARPPLSKAGGKDVSAYDRASRDYMKRRRLLEHADRSPSLGVLVARLISLAGEVKGAE